MNGREDCAAGVVVDDDVDDDGDDKGPVDASM